MKAAAYFFFGLVILMGVVGGVESMVDPTFTQALQAVGLTLVAIAFMAIGVSYAKE